MTNNTLDLAIKASGVVLALFLAIYVVTAFFQGNDIAACPERLGDPRQFALVNEAGTLMSPSELQARVGIGEVGVIENASVAEHQGEASAMKVRLVKGSGAIGQDKAPQGGISFRWNPEGLSGAAAACLSYKVWLPEDFDFAKAGTLPGLFGGLPTALGEKPDAASTFGSRVLWRDQGGLAVSAQHPADGKTNEMMLSPPKGTRLPRGRWVAIDQELVLNTPGATDGAMRLWVDGDLKLERDGMTWRTDPAANLAGIAGDIHYGGGGVATTAPADAELAISPLEVRWQ